MEYFNEHLRCVPHFSVTISTVACILGVNKCATSLK